MAAFKKMSLPFLFLASAIMMAHNLVPHVHHSGGAGEVIASHCFHEDNSLLGLLESAFHIDLGNEHLENLKPASNQVVNLLAPFVLVVISFDLRLLVEKGNNNFVYLPSIPLTNPFFLSSNAHRGPPVA